MQPLQLHQRRDTPSLWLAKSLVALVVHSHTSTLLSPDSISKVKILIMHHQFYNSIAPKVCWCRYWWWWWWSPPPHTCTHLSSLSLLGLHPKIVQSATHLSVSKAKHRQAVDVRLIFLIRSYLFGYACGTIDYASPSSIGRKCSLDGRHHIGSLRIFYD